MTLAEYMRSLDQDGKARFAARVGTTVETLYQIAGHHTGCSAKRARDIERGSYGAVPRLSLLYPDEYAI